MRVNIKLTDPSSLHSTSVLPSVELIGETHREPNVCHLYQQCLRSAVCSLGGIYCAKLTVKHLLLGRGQSANLAI